MTAPNKVLLETAEKAGLKVASGNLFLGGYIGCEIDKNKFVKEKFVFGQYFRTIHSRKSLEKRCLRCTNIRRGRPKQNRLLLKLTWLAKENGKRRRKHYSMFVSLTLMFHHMLVSQVKKSLKVRYRKE